MVRPGGPGARRVPWYLDRRLCYALLFVVAATLGTRRILGGTSDLRNVLEAARELGTGLDTYRARDPIPPYAYPHCVTVLFAPLAALPDEAAEILFGLTQGLATVLLVLGLERIGRAQVALAPWHWLALAVLFGRTIDQCYTHGQLALWVAALLTWAVQALIEGRGRRAGLLIGAAAAMKLTPLLFVPALLAMRARRAALWAGASFGVLVLLLPWPFLGTQEHLRHLREFHAAMIRPLLDPDSGMPQVWGGGDHNIRGTLSTLLQAHTTTDGHPMPALVDLPSAAVRWIVLGYSMLIGTLVAVAFWRFRRGPRHWTVPWQSSVVLLAMAFFSPLTRVYHLATVTLPVFLFVLHGPGRGARRVGFVLICAALLLSLALRQKSLLGEDAWRWLHYCGLLHFALVGMLVWILGLAFRAQPSGSAEPEGAQARCTDAAAGIAAKPSA